MPIPLFENISRMRLEEFYRQTETVTQKMRTL